jgi:hypothetical protein
MHSYLPILFIVVVHPSLPCQV